MITVTGDSIAAQVAAMKRDVLVALKASVAGATEYAKAEIRADIRAAGLGERLPNAVGSKVFPRGDQLAYAPTGSIFGRGPSAVRILAAFSAGVTIQAGQGRWLAIPTEAGSRLMGGRHGNPADALRKLRTAKVGRGAKRRTVVDRSLDLRVIPLERGGKAQAAVVAVGATYGQSGAVRAASKGRAAQGMREQQIVLFWLVRTVTLGKRLDPRRALLAAEAIMPRLFEDSLRRLNA